ncbi:hypothetical protein BBJ28_00001101, partial [Nothophytophthora sp. Chile5]
MSYHRPVTTQHLALERCGWQKIPRRRADHIQTGGQTAANSKANMSKSMGLNVAGGLSSLLKDGHKHFEGVDEAVAKNIDAVKQLAAITRSSLGPNGMNKLVINHLEKI